MSVHNHTSITGYTPGPWELIDNEDLQPTSVPRYAIETRRRGRWQWIASINYVYIPERDGPDTGHVNEVPNETETEANAHLIASAPDMAETINRQAKRIERLERTISHSAAMLEDSSAGTQYITDIISTLRAVLAESESEVKK